jgi:uncharacterized CHY-type Zn-finger protein
MSGKKGHKDKHREQTNEIVQIQKMTEIEVKCIICGKSFKNQMSYFLMGMLEICDECRSSRNRKVKNGNNG